MDWLTRLDKFYYRLTEQDKAILLYLESHRLLVIDMTSQALAEACFVSRSSISRFLKKMEIDTFAELKFLLQGVQQPENSSQANFHLVAQKYHTYIDQIFGRQDLKPIVELLLETERLYLYGTGNAQKMELESFRQLFTSVGKPVATIFDKGEYDYIKDTFSDRDLLLLLSYKGESQEAISILKDAGLSPVTSLVMTQTSNNSMAKLADFQLYVPTESIVTPTKLTYEVSTTFYFIIDQLFYDYTMALERTKDEP